MHDVFKLAAVASSDEIRVRLKSAAGAEKALLRAVLAQYDGDVDGAIQTLRHQLKVCEAYERVFIADMLAPMLVMRHDSPAVFDLADIIEAAQWKASAHALRALAAAEMRDRRNAELYSAAASALSNAETDDIARFRILQRLARAAYLLADFEKALDLAVASAALATSCKAWRAAAAGYSVAYNIYHAVLGDVVEADRYASLTRKAAEKSHDESFTHGALVAEFELAVQLADDERVKSLGNAVSSRLLPQQYTERFPLALSQGLVHGWSDLIGMRTLLQVIRETPRRSRGEWSLCTGLIAVAEASYGDDQSARESIRAASSQLGRASMHDPAYELRYRRLARASIAAACVLVGDNVRAGRIISAREGQAADGSRSIPHLIISDLQETEEPSMRGMFRIFRRAKQNRLEESVPAGLTRAELEILRLLSTGRSAVRIAHETERSVNTVYNHTRSILMKLDVSRAAEAVALARERGLLR